MADTSHDYFKTAQPRYETIVTVFGPTRDSSWTVFRLAYKLIGRHEHNTFTVGPFCLILNIDSPSYRA